MSLDEFMRGHVLISRTVNLGNFNSIRVEVSEDYRLDQSTFEAKFDDLADRLKTKLLEAGLVKP